MGLELARCSCITQSDPVILYVPNILEHYSIHWFGNNCFFIFFFKIPLRTDNWTPVYGSALQYLPLLTISNHLYHSWNTAIYGNVDSLSSRHYSTSEIRNKKKNTSCSPWNLINRHKLTLQFSKTLYAWMFLGLLQNRSPPPPRWHRAA